MKAIFVPFLAIKYMSRLKNKSSFLLDDFVYDNITDEMISFEMGNAQIEDLKEDWISEKIPNHARRIASLVKLMQSKIKLDPVDMEISQWNSNVNFVNDGHHRIRAAKFLKKLGFYA